MAFVRKDGESPLVRYPQLAVPWGKGKSETVRTVLLHHILDVSRV